MPLQLLLLQQEVIVNKQRHFIYWRSCVLRLSGRRGGIEVELLLPRYGLLGIKGKEAELGARPEDVFVYLIKDLSVHPVAAPFACRATA